MRRTLFLQRVVLLALFYLASAPAFAQQTGTLLGVVRVAQATRLDVELAVGALQETVTVSGESPVVDVSSTTTQTNIDKELYEAIPTGRNPWVMAGLVPGVVTGRLDVGGTEGIEEYNMQTASGTAESDVSGVYMNMVTKSGGDRFASDHNFYFMNDKLQGGNVDDALRTRLGLQAGQRTGAAGNPIDVSYDWSSTIGGPLKRDRAGVFGALRRWGLHQFPIR